MKRLKITTLDWYIIKKFIGTFFFSIAMIIAISVVFDFAEKVDDFMTKDASARAILLDYYANFIPYFINLFTPLFVFIAVIFFTSKMAARSEIIAILSSGVHFGRLLYPYFLSAAVIFLLSLFLSHFVIPDANRKRLQFENTYIRRPRYVSTYNIHKQMRPGFFVYLQSYDPDRAIGYRLCLEQFEEGRLKSKLWANTAQWDSTTARWQLDRWYQRDYLADRDTVTSGQSLDTVFYVEPKDLARTEHEVQTLNRRELNQFIAQQRLQGASDIDNSLVEKYGRTATPFAVFILTVIGVSVSSHKRRGGTGIHITIGLVISFSYILLMRFSTMFAIGGSLSPLLAVWLPNIIFAAVAYVLYRLAPK